MKKDYTKPEVVVTSFESDASVMTLSATGVQTKMTSKSYSTIDF